MRSRWAMFGAAGALVIATTVGVPGSASAAPSSFVSFDAFLKSTAQTSFAGLAALGQAGAVSSAQSFNAMRSYVLNLYQGVQVAHSYQADGSYFDCVTVASQPGAQAVGGKVLAKAPTPSQVGLADESTAEHAASPLTLGLKDAFGNAVSCGAGTIPMQRVSLDRLTKFATLDKFLAKSPDGAVGGGVSTQVASRQYAYGTQTVANHGGNAVLNLWNPQANFSISQQWYSTGSGSSTQTLEGGWIKYPSKFGNSSVTFIFFTPDNYSHGCYNLECAGFIQTNSNWALGGAWSAYSTPGGAQKIFTLQWKLYQGNWWLYLQGGGNIEAVGYYPGAVYGNGSMRYGAARMLAGGEVAPSNSTWPLMGSGAFASAGFGYAAYQRSLFYINTSDASVWTSLSPVETSHACYTIAYTPSTAGSSWGTYFYFGGPGNAVDIC
jgi:hypothetical protein